MINLGYLEYCTLKHLVFLLVILKAVTLEAAEPGGMGKLNKENGLPLNCYRAMLKQIATSGHMVARSELVFTVSTILTWCDPEGCISPSVPFLPGIVEISEVPTAEGDC